MTDRDRWDETVDLLGRGLSPTRIFERTGIPLEYIEKVKRECHIAGIREIMRRIEESENRRGD